MSVWITRSEAALIVISIAFFCWGYREAHGAPTGPEVEIDVVVVRPTSDYLPALALSESEALDVIYRGTQFLEGNTSARFVLGRATVVGMRFPYLNTIEGFIDRFYAWRSDLHLNSRRQRKRNVITIVAVPPIPVGDGRYGYAGLASTNCLSREATILATVGRYSTKDPTLDRVYASSLIVAHELAHVLSADHLDSSVNLMHPSLGLFIDDYRPIPISGFTVDKVSRCFSRVARATKRRELIKIKDRASRCSSSECIKKTKKEKRIFLSNWKTGLL